MNYFNVGKKAQTLTELAAFGSVMLVVLSFFVSYGMRYIYNQDAQMRAFRLALNEAYYPTDTTGKSVPDRPDASASIVLLEDKHIPNPQDMFGVGNIVPVQAGAEVTWGNTLKEEIKNSADFPRMKYRINNQEKEYTTAGQPRTVFSGPVYIELPGVIGRVQKNFSELYIYQPDENLPKQAGVKVSGTDKELISEVFLSMNPDEPAMKIIKVLPEDSNDGDQVTGLEVINSAGGAIDLRYTQLDRDINGDGIPDVTPANVQGLLLDNEQEIKRKDELTITQNKDKITATTDRYDMRGTKITHKIRGNSAAPNTQPAEPVQYTHPYSRQGSF